MKTVLENIGNTAWTVRRYDDAGGLVEEVTNAIPVSALCRRLKKSRRQIYRYLKQGTIKPLGKFLGEWLVDIRGSEHLERRAARRRPIPPSARILFPEYDAGRLHAYRDASLIIPKIMEQGDRLEIRWMLSQYSSGWIKGWLAREGWRLSPRAARFWSWWLKTPFPRPRPIPPKL